MEERGRFWNIVWMVLGILLMGLCLPFVVRRQYLIFVWGGNWSEGAWAEYSTIGMFLVGIWFFLFGLIGFIHEKRRREGPSE
jgi:hypothetical protein